MGSDVEPSVRVLVVDDEDDIRALTRALLVLDGRFQIVGEATNGAEAVALALQCQPDAIVLDVLMPVMPGNTALPLLRAVAPGAAVVAFSALHPQDPRLAQIQQDADAYVRKDEPSSLTHALWRAVLEHGSVRVHPLTTGSR